jgi:four helix bundle protein
MTVNDLKLRTFTFAVNIAGLVKALPYDFINKHYFNQLIRCSSSIGANYRAAQRAKSSADFINKLKIVEEEADESLFFLELLQEINPSHKDLIQPLLAEGLEILKIIVASINTVRKRDSNMSHS